MIPARVMIILPGGRKENEMRVAARRERKEGLTGRAAIVL